MCLHVLKFEFRQANQSTLKSCSHKAIQQTKTELPNNTSGTLNCRAETLTDHMSSQQENLVLARVRDQNRVPVRSIHNFYEQVIRMCPNA